MTKVEIPDTTSRVRRRNIKFREVVLYSVVYYYYTTTAIPVLI